MKKFAKIFMAVAMMFGLISAVLAPQPVYANDCDVDGDGETDISTAILDCNKLSGTEGEGIFYILSIALSILTFGIGAAATLGFIISGYQYITARDNAAQVLKAKTRMLHIVIGLVAYALFWVVINFLIPGGVLNR